MNSINERENNKPIFCIVGQTGSGKTSILKELLSNDKLNCYYKLKNLVYSTTRSIRSGEINGVDYNFKSADEYKIDLNNNVIVEDRTYVTKNNGKVHYYTTIEELTNYNQIFKGIICSASVNQAISYSKLYKNVYFIVIDSPVIERMSRIITNRLGFNSSDAEYIELCRRICNENEEFNKIWSYLYPNNHVTIFNRNYSGDKYFKKSKPKFNKIEISAIDSFICSKILEYENKHREKKSNISNINHI